MAAHSRIFRKKLVIVGDSVGKTSLFESYMRKSVPSWYVSRRESYVADIVMDNGLSTCELALWDTIDTKVQPLRPYPNTDIILLCFSLADIDTLEHVEEKWYYELNHLCPDVPIILLGTKLDLREDEEYASTNDGGCVTMAEGLRMKAKNANVVKYMECSAITRYGVDEVFDEAARIACLKRPAEQRNCLIM